MIVKRYSFHLLQGVGGRAHYIHRTVTSLTLKGCSDIKVCVHSCELAGSQLSSHSLLWLSQDLDLFQGILFFYFLFVVTRMTRGVKSPCVLTVLVFVFASFHAQGAPASTKYPWLPAGVSYKDWVRCHGMPCDEFDQTQTLIKEIIKKGSENQQPGTGEGAQHPSSNRPLVGTLDNCIMLTGEQAQWLLSGMVENPERDVPPLKQPLQMNDLLPPTDDLWPSPYDQARKMTNFIRNPTRMWTDMPVLYKFDGKHKDFEQDVVRSAFQHWMDNTCLRFREVPTDKEVKTNHILITAEATGCHSYVGKVRFYPQQLNLKYNCIWEFGVPVHEIGHAMGLFHEQMRFDRDNSIKINWDNLQSYKGQYAKVSQTASSSLGVPYDLGSVMHYSPKDGSSNGQVVMEAYDQLYQHSMGQRTGMSFLDRMIINRAYCKDTCRTTLQRPCQRNGYQDPNDCSRCICSDGIGGPFCETVAPSSVRGSSRRSASGTCGGVVQVNPSSAAVITSPGYDTVQSYNDHTECNWLLQAPAGKKLKLTFEGEFGVYCHHQQQCYHWLEAQYKDIGMPGPRFCCYTRPMTTLTSENNEMVLVFRSNWTASFSTYRRGFKVKVVTEDAGHGPPVPTTTEPSVGGSTGSISQWECGFENDQLESTWCGIEQLRDDQFDWTMQVGRSPSFETGPQNAHEGKYYIFIEASDPRREGDKASIRLPALQTSGGYCMTFYYSMYGFHTRRLELFKESPQGGRSVIWSLEGEQDKHGAWFSAQKDVNLSQGERLGFTAFRGAAFSGDIGLDTLKLKRGSC